MNRCCRWALAVAMLWAVADFALAPLAARAQISIMAEDPLVAGVKANDQGSVIRALVRGSNPNVRDGAGIPVLAVAAQFGEADAVQTLLEHGAKVDVPDNDGNTALGHAAAHGHVEVLRLLLAAHASIDRPNKQGETALILAARSGQYDAAAALVKAGAKLDLADYAGHTPLFYARLNRHARLARLIEQSGGTD